nr:MAG: HEAT repeat domain-containing protein [Candidatus Methanoperedens sp.]
MEERKRAVEELKINFAILNDKEQAWDDLHMLTQDNKDDVRIGAANAFGSCYPHILEAYKNQAWDDLHMLTQDNKDDVRIGAANALGSCYPHIPEECKNQALDDLHMLTQDNNEDVRIGATNALSSCYPHIPEKHKKQKQAWNDLYRLTQDKDSDVRRIAADVLVSSYFLFSKKYKDYAWNDLHMLTQDKDGNVRKIVADALSSSYSQIPEQYIKQAWNDLHRLTQDKNNYVRRSAADALGSCYSQIPEKYRKHTCDDLHMLTQDKDANVRISANHSSGRVSIYRASQAKGDESVRTELERALRFFEKSSKESTYFNPAKFCLPFYRSFYTITFKKESAEDEVKKYFAEAKEAVKGSESKEKLLEAVENLGNALKEVQKARNLDAIKSDLNAYRQYCDRACELLDTTEERAPGASGLIRKGLPIIDKKIKEMLKEIEEKTRQFCQESRQTPFEKISRNTYYQVKGLGEVDSQDEAETRLNNLRSLLQSMCSILPEESMKLIRRQLDEIKDAKLSDKVKILENTLISIAVGIKNLEYRSTEQKKEIDYFKDLVIRRLDNINYGVFQLKLRSGEMAPALWNIKYELNRIQTDFTNFGINLEDVRNLQHQSIQHLNDKMTKLASEIETKVVIELPKTYETQKILDELKIFNQCIQKSKPCTSEVWFNRMAGLASIIGGILTILPKG